MNRLRNRWCSWTVKRTIAVLLILGFTPASHAVVIDLSRMTCQEFLASNKDEIRIIWAWLDGYYKDEQDLPIMDTNTMVDNLKGPSNNAVFVHDCEPVRIASGFQR